MNFFNVKLGYITSRTSGNSEKTSVILFVNITWENRKKKFGKTLEDIFKDCFLYRNQVTKENLHKMFGMNFFPEAPRPFKTQYRCFSVSMLPGNERNDLEHGGKIILPPSALDQLTRLNIVYPMLFKLTNAAASRTTHCGTIFCFKRLLSPNWLISNFQVCLNS